MRPTALALALMLAACSPAAMFSAPTPLPDGLPTRAPKAIFVETPIVPPDVPMIDVNGRSVTLSTLRGKFVFVTVSNIDCVQACTDGLTLFRAVKHLLGERSDVAYLLIGTDIKVDSPRAMKAYLAEFDPAFLGYTAERAQMRDLLVHFGIHTFIRSDGALAPHAPFTYLIDRQGRLVYFFQTGLTPLQVVEAARKVL